MTEEEEPPVTIIVEYLEGYNSFQVTLLNCEKEKPKQYTVEQFASFFRQWAYKHQEKRRERYNK